MRSSGRLESRGAWTEVQTVTAFEDAYQDRILRAVWKQDDLWLVAADVGAILGARNVERMVSRMPSGAKGVATFYTAGRPETLDVIETFALGSMIIDSNAPTISDFRRWLTGSLLPAAFRQSDCRFRIRDDGTSQFQTSQIGQFDLTFGEDGVLYVTRVLWRERTKRPTLTPLCLPGSLPVWASGAETRPSATRRLLRAGSRRPAFMWPYADTAFPCALQETTSLSFANHQERNDRPGRPRAKWKRSR